MCNASVTLKVGKDEPRLNFDLELRGATAWVSMSEKETNEAIDFLVDALVFLREHKERRKP